MQYGYFNGISWWPWVLAGTYTVIALVLFFATRSTYRLPVGPSYLSDPCCL